MLTLSLFGATVTSWKQGGKERLFLSSKSSLDSSKAVSSDGIPEVISAFWTRVDLVDTIDRSEVEFPSSS